jgi:3-hydroxyacyl-CoA dehydrogenase
MLVTGVWLRAAWRFGYAEVFDLTAVSGPVLIMPRRQNTPSPGRTYYEKPYGLVQIVRKNRCGENSLALWCGYDIF